MEIDRQAGVAVWHQIEQQLAGEIAAGQPAPGAQLPNELEIARRFGVHRHTARRAVAALVGRGLVRIARGQGTFVEDSGIDYVIGNGDAHGVHFGLLHEDGGTRLAPLYGLASTVVYDMPTHVGMVVNEDYDQTVYLLEMGWISEESGVDFDEVRKLAAAVARRVGDALERLAERARAEAWHAPVIDDIVGLAAERATGLGFEADY